MVISLVLFFVGLVVGVVLFYFLQQKTSSNLTVVSDISDIKKQDIDLDDDNAIKDLIVTLLDKLDTMSKNDTKLQNKLDSLQQLSGVRGEQIKYLTSNANKSV
tara:strand:- start:13 stop:321 length:309 start_codon:yes stop_codon:yes gene_type:complete